MSLRWLCVSFCPFSVTRVMVLCLIFCDVFVFMLLKCLFMQFVYAFLFSLFCDFVIFFVCLLVFTVVLFRPRELERENTNLSCKSEGTQEENVGLFSVMVSQCYWREQNLGHHTAVSYSLVNPPLTGPTSCQSALDFKHYICQSGELSSQKQKQHNRKCDGTTVKSHTSEVAIVSEL